MPSEHVPMRRARHDRFPAHRGFTLIETIMVLTTLGLAAAAIVTLQGNIFYRHNDNKDVQVGVQMMQECAELILATRRASGFGDSTLTARTASNVNCSSVTLGSYAAPLVTITDGDSTSITGCPTNTACKLVSVAQGGLTPITLMLVNY